MRLALPLLLSIALGVLAPQSVANAGIIIPGSSYDVALFTSASQPEAQVFGGIVFDGLSQTFKRTPDPGRTVNLTITERVTGLLGGAHLITIEFSGDGNLFKTGGDGGFVQIGWTDNPLDLARPVTLESAILTFYSGETAIDLDDSDFLPDLASSFGSLSPWDGSFLTSGPPPVYGGLVGIADLDVDRITLDLRVREIPEPGTVALLGTAIAGLGIARRYRRT